MPITEREFEQLKELMEQNHQTIMGTLQLRKQYWDERIDKICAVVSETKHHCERQTDTCAIVFKEHWKRIDENSNDITRIKTVGGVIALLWIPLVEVGKQILRKIGG